MKVQRRTVWLAGLAGLVFALGLAISGMTDPRNVIAFLNVGSQWDPSLAFVMAGALLVFAPGYWWSQKSALGLRAQGGAHRRGLVQGRIDRPLLLGSALFGLGWGLAGYCPGPALSSIAAGREELLLFVACMLFGMLAARRLRRSGV